MPELGPQTYATVNGYLRLDREPRPGEARGCGEARDRPRAEAGESGRATSSSPDSSRRTPARSAVGNEPRTVRLSSQQQTRTLGSPFARPTARAPDGRVPAHATGARSIPPHSVARAAQKAARVTQSHARSSPGCTPSCSSRRPSADLMSSCSAAHSTRAPPTKVAARSRKQGGGTKLGEKIADERVTIFSDPTDRDLLAQPFDAEGTAAAAAWCGSRTAF